MTDLFWFPKKQGLEVDADSDFRRNWHKPTDPEEVSTAKLCMGYVILYSGCLIIWAYMLKLGTSDIGNPGINPNLGRYRIDS